MQRLARIGGQARTSILIDPADGKVPLLAAAWTRLRARRLQELRNFDATEMPPLIEQCLVISGPPMIGADRLPIVQTPDYVTINTE